MKKAIQFMLLAALVVSVSGCANTNHPQAIRESSDIEALRSEIDENAVPKETLTDCFSESKTSSDDSVIDVKAETESSQAETPQPTAEQSPALGIRSGTDDGFVQYRAGAYLHHHDRRGIRDGRANGSAL